MRKHLSRRAFSLLLAVLMVVTLLPSMAFAANVNISDVSGLGASYSDNGSWKYNSGILSGSVTGTAEVSIFGYVISPAANRTTTLTLKNNLSTAAVLTFKYAKPSLAAGGNSRLPCLRESLCLQPVGCIRRRSLWMDR